MLTPNQLRAEIVARRTYQRPLNEEGTKFESWKDVCHRVVWDHQRWLWERALGRSLNNNEKNELRELEALLLDRKALLAGRTLWLGGTETSKRREISQVNCLGKETPFITSLGVKTFEDFQDGDTCEVLTHTGAWKKAVVRQYGEQQLYKLHFTKGRSNQYVRATKNHTWILKDGTRTSDIFSEIGSNIHIPSTDVDNWNWDTAPWDEQLYWVYGYVYGDGCKQPNVSGGTYKRTTVRLCDKDRRFADRFVSLGFSTSQPHSCKGDFIAYTGSYLKTLPDVSVDSLRLVKAFMQGWMDADGAKNLNFNFRGGKGAKFKSIQATGQESCDYLRKVLPLCGWFILKEDDLTGQTTNFGVRSAVTIRFCVSTTFTSNNTFKYVGNTKDVKEPVWCLEVEDDHSFTLANGLVTGNCSFTEIRNINDVVDAFWLLLNGAGVGFKPVPGTLNGFKKPVKEIEVVRTQKSRDERGREGNLETFNEGVWTISIGDSGEAWAKSIGKLLSGKYDADKLVFDFSEVRGAGGRLKGYGWISSGDEVISEVYPKIARLLSSKAGQLLDEIDILDIINYLGVIQTGRRGAEIAFSDYGSKNWERFATAKKDFWLHDNHHRTQSNNSLLFHRKPSKAELVNVFNIMLDSGGSEPGIINAEAMQRRAPWAVGTNPCVTGDMVISTTEYGYVPATYLVGKQFTVPFFQPWNGKTSFKSTEKGFWLTGFREVIKLTLDNGEILRCTPEHKIAVSSYVFEGQPEAISYYWEEAKDCVGLWVIRRGMKDDKEFNTNRVVKIEEDGFEDVYDCTVPGLNGFLCNNTLVHNCAEILLSDAGICNLCTLNIAAFESLSEAQRAYYIIGRANYRQTLMNLDDGILQIKWHQTNQFLRLCGTSMMGVAMKQLSDYDLKVLKNSAISGAMSMAFELGTELPKNITTQKPEGTAAKIAGCTEGIHKPLGKYIFNNITFSRHEPIVEKLRNAGYNVFDNPSQPDGVVVTFPVCWEGVTGFTNVNGTEVNLESAVDQLERYKTFMSEWTEQNSSITVSYSPEEIPSIIDWLDTNWDSYVGVSFILRADPTKSAKDLGYLYLPQEVVTKERYEEYVSRLKSVTLDDLKEAGAVEDIDFLDSSCENGVCPIR